MRLDPTTIVAAWFPAGVRIPHSSRAFRLGLVFGALLASLACSVHVSDCEALASVGWALNAGWTVNVTGNSTWCCANQNGIICDASQTRVV